MTSTDSSQGRYRVTSVLWIPRSVRQSCNKNGKSHKLGRLFETLVTENRKAHIHKVNNFLFRSRLPQFA